MNSPLEDEDDDPLPLGGTIRLPSAASRRSSHASVGSCFSCTSAGVQSGSVHDLLRDVAINDVDVAENHGVGCAPIRGRESHTADLDVFDRYVKLMEAERSQMVELEEVEAEGQQADDGSLGDNASTTPPFNSAFWSYVRSILGNAKPVGFHELDDPQATVPKGPDDCNAFIQKAVGIGPINPIIPTALAQGGNFTEEEVLTELLYATRVGVVRMQFAPECDRCGSVVTARDRLGELPARAACEGCNYPNDINSLDRIKVIFLLNPDILYVLADNFACTPSTKSMEKTAIFATVPATSTGSGFRYSVGVGGDLELRPALDPGRYRMHCPVAKTDNYLVVERKAKEEEDPYRLELRVSDVVCDPSTSCAPLPKPGRGAVNIEKRAAEHRSHLKTLTVPHGKVHFDVLPDTKSFFVLWVQEDAEEDELMHLPEEERAGYTRATSVVHNRVFNRLFADQVVSSNPDVLLSIQNVVLVFTDVVGSTDLYASIGDGPALQLIRNHFRVLFGAFTKRGRVVKTVGDAVMASFTTGRAAMEAVADALRLLPRECRLPDGTPLQIRVGIHCGPAIVVPVNGVNDFFGQTVNIAARVEHAAKASECFVTEDVLASDPDSRNAYYEIISPKYVRRRSSNESHDALSVSGSGETGKKVFDATPETELYLKGVEGVVRARGFRLHKRPRRASDVLGGEPKRTYNRAEMYERLDLSGQSVGSNENEDSSIAGAGRPRRPSVAMIRRASKRASTLGDLEEENSNPFDTDADSYSTGDQRFSIEDADEAARKR